MLRLLRNLLGRRTLRRDVDDEIRDAFETLVEERMRAGLSDAEARREATLAFGRVESVTAQVMDVRAGAFWDPLWQDIRFGARMLARRPLFAIFAVASLALAIGATAAIFTLFDRLVLRSLPIADPQQLVVASFGGPNGRFNYSMPYPQFDAIRQRTTTLSGVYATSPFGRLTLTLGAESQIAEGMLLSGDYYRVLGLMPAAGRLLQPGDDRPGQALAVLSYNYWQLRFGGRPDIIGAAITLSGVPFTIVGVEPRGFLGTEVGRPYDVAVPMQAVTLLREGSAHWDAATTTWIYIMGRLKPGVTLTQAEAESRAIFAQVSMDAAKDAGDQKLAREHQLRLEPGATGNASELRESYGVWLRQLLLVLGCVLLLASLNVATLLLSQSDARQREIVTRLALGAGRARIVRQLLTESLLLAMAAAAIGFVLAAVGSQVLLRIALSTRNQMPFDLMPDWRLALFTVAVSVGTCVLFGLIPAIRSTSPRRLLANRQIGGVHRSALDRGLVVAQVALSLVLLVVAGLFLRTLGQLWAQDPGYDRHNVLMFSIDARLIGKRGPDVLATYQRVLDELRSVPGAQVITASAVRPVSENYYFIDSVGQVGDRMLSDDQSIRVAINNLAPRFFETMRIPLIAGRDFTDGDALPTRPMVVIISERMARHFAGNPIGQLIGSGRNTAEVIGVARDMRYASVKAQPREVLYFPLMKATPGGIGYAPSFEIRFAGPAVDVVRGTRQAVARVDSGLQMFAMRTLEEQTTVSLTAERLLALLMSYFGIFALALSGIGLYGVMSDRVTLRTAEIGLRLALGAQQEAVRWLVLREALLTVTVGVIAGLAAALGGVQLVRSQLFGVEPHDPIALASATGVLVAIACAAAYIPARRASRIDPLGALRHE